MSKTRCRFCALTFEGLYLNCPKCGKWLPPLDGEDLPPDNSEYRIVEDYSGGTNDG